MSWEIVIRQPGQFGKKKTVHFKNYDQQFGVGNWRVAWDVSQRDCLPFIDMATLFYEEAYMAHLCLHPELWRDLCQEAVDIYDDHPTNVLSGLDYSIQQTDCTHVQDISIRRCLTRAGLPFVGNSLVQIRHHLADNRWSLPLSPGIVEFHMPNLLPATRKIGWWNRGSVEDFYQSCKVIQRCC